MSGTIGPRRSNTKRGQEKERKKRGATPSGQLAGLVKAPESAQRGGGAAIGGTAHWHHTCDWHIRNHHATPKIRQLVRTSCINGVQGDRISQDIFLLSEAYTTAIFNAGVQALCHEWENKMPVKVRESLEPLLTCTPWYVGATPPGLNNNNLMCETANADVQRHYNDCYGEIGHALNVIEAAEWYMTNIIPEWSREKTSWTRQRTHHKVSFGTGKKKYDKDQWERALDLRRNSFLNQITIDTS